MAANSGITAHPLCWPLARPRTRVRSRPKFTAGSFAIARDSLLAELKRLGATGVVLSTNVALRQDGLPYAGQRQPDDPGVAIYFTRRGRDLCLTCDRWQKVEENMDALRRWIEAQRGQERWVGSEMIEAVFTGFAALPPAAPTTGGRWWEVLGVKAHESTAGVTEAYKALAMKHHPSRGGDTAVMQTINAAYDQFKKERGL